jgi:hypothetical protein
MTAGGTRLYRPDHFRRNRQCLQKRYAVPELLACSEIVVLFQER